MVRTHYVKELYDGGVLTYSWLMLAGWWSATLAASVTSDAETEWRRTDSAVAYRSSRQRNGKELAPLEASCCCFCRFLMLNACLCDMCKI